MNADCYRPRRAAARTAALLLCLSPVWLARAGAPPATAPAATPAVIPAPGLVAAVASPERTPRFVARDAARHPVEELTFFGLKPDSTVIELWPGGGYWTEILAPYVREHGHYIAGLTPIVPDGEENASTLAWQKNAAARAAAYGTVRTVWFGKDAYDLGAPDTADLIVTFRNLHNWVGDGYADAALAACFRVLKPGGILGIEDHRGRTDVPQDPKAENGYLREDYAIALAEKAGFRLVGKSQINANPRDTKDWVDGVWTLPPTLSQGDRDREKYLAVGEADNFVLKFEKPRR